MRAARVFSWPDLYVDFAVSCLPNYAALCEKFDLEQDSVYTLLAHLLMFVCHLELLLVRLMRSRHLHTRVILVGHLQLH